MTNFFYTDTNGQKHLINDQQLKTLVGKGIVTPHTPLETEGGHSGLAGQIPGLFDTEPLSCSQTVPPVTSSTIIPETINTYFRRLTPSTITPQTINTYYEWYRRCTVVAASTYIGVPILFGLWFALACIGDMVFSSTGLWNVIDSTPFVAIIPVIIFSLIFAFIIGIIADIAGTVFKMLLLYQLWELIPPDIARTTPGKAVGFCFIPFFNLYWAFIAYMGLGEDINKTLQQRGIQYQVDKHLGLGLCITYCVTYVIDLIPPSLGFIQVVGDIMLIFFLKSIKNGAIVMLEQSEQQTHLPIDNTK